MAARIRPTISIILTPAEVRALTVALEAALPSLSESEADVIAGVLMQIVGAVINNLEGNG